MDTEEETKHISRLSGNAPPKSGGTNIFWNLWPLPWRQKRTDASVHEGTERSGDLKMTFSSAKVTPQRPQEGLYVPGSEARSKQLALILTETSRLTSTNHQPESILLEGVL